MALVCSICGHDEFADQKVLWPSLIKEWQISPDEAAYVDRQQGTHCTLCRASLRAIALGNAILATQGPAPTVTELVRSPGSRLHVLDLNGTGASEALAALPHYTRADYPDVDMQAMPYSDCSFDLVVHSDTLEHVLNPIHALVECRRVLKPGGSLCFTIPMIVGRLTRSRAGLPSSYHGNPAESGFDFVVHSEFGADAWTYPVRAGFRDIAIHTVEFPAATAMSAIK